MVLPLYQIIDLQQLKRSITLPTSMIKQEVYEIVLVTQGYLVRQCNKHTIRINANEIHLSVVGQYVTINHLSDNVAGYSCIISREAILSNDLKATLKRDLQLIYSFMTNYPLRISPAITTRIMYLMNTIQQLTSYPQYNKGLLEGYLHAIVCEIKHIIIHEMPLFPPTALAIAQRYEQLLSEYIFEEHSISFYAEKLKISPNHLNKVVRIVYGKSAIALLNEQIILEATQMLEQQIYSVSEVAYRLGFTDPSYFTRCFKHATGITPLHYVKGL